MSKTIYGYADIFSPEHIHFTPNERIAFKYLLDNGYENCVVNTQKHSLVKVTKKELINDYKRRIKTLSEINLSKEDLSENGYIAADVTIKVNIKMKKEKLSILEKTDIKEFLLFNGCILYKK